jgi:manganese/zinc/iron transport system substrate-binding protein
MILARLRRTTSHPGARRRRRAVASSPALLAALAIAGCGTAGSVAQSASPEELAGRQVQVTATTNWHTDLARQIGGDRAEVTGLMGPGVDPHLYEASAGDVQALGEADIAVWNGLELEGKMEEVFDEIGEVVPVVTVGEAVPEELLIEIEGTDEFDPHIWFEVEAWEAAAGAVAEAYKEVDPEHAAGYDQRLDEYVSELERVDASIAAAVERIPEESRVLVTSHDAFTYFGEAYGFEVAPIQGKSTAGEATTADIERVAQTVADADLDAIFIESSVPPQTIEAVLAAAADRGQPTEVGGELLGDSLGSPDTPEGDYAGALRHNADVIVEGLGS